MELRRTTSTCVTGRCVRG